MVPFEPGFWVPNRATSIPHPFQTDFNPEFTCNIKLQVGLATVVVESAVTAIYICYAEDPSLVRRWDAEFFNKMSETLHQRLQHRSARARQVLTNRFDSQMQEAVPI